jgi:hypothetical protein
MRFLPAAMTCNNRGFDSKEMQPGTMLGFDLR